jgi:protocatechuate 3,4-dioxygenase beta subunit
MRRSGFRIAILVGASGWLISLGAAADKPLPPRETTPNEGTVTVTYHPISLEAFSRKPLSHYRSTDSWGIPPRGRQIIKGVPYLIEGKAEVTGMGAARDGTFFPTRVTGIPVGAMGQTIHLLHGAGYDAKDGTPMAEMVLNYRNGAMRSLIISYGVHSRNWYEEAQERNRNVSDPHSAIGWYGSRQDTGFNPSLRLYTTAWRNPLPGEMIETIDFYSLFSRATPSFVALTLAEETVGSSSDFVDDAPVVRTAAGSSRSTLRTEMKVRVLDGSGVVLTNATIDVRCTDGTRWIAFGQLHGPGPTVLDYPPATFQLVRFTAVAPGYAPSFLLVAAQPDRTFPQAVQIKLEKGDPIGGVVHNANEQRIAGVTVHVRSSVRDENGRLIPVDHSPVTTDLKGQWKLSGVSSPGVAQIVLEHPLYERRTVPIVAADPDSKALQEALRAGSAQFPMVEAITVRGTITDALAQPVGQAELRWGISTVSWTNETRAPIAANGSFEFAAASGQAVVMMASAPGFAPRLVSVRVSPDSKPVSIALEPAKPLHGRVLDQRGQPIPGVTITVDQWQSMRSLNWMVQTDKDGRFTWQTPPPTGLELGFNKVGYQPLRRHAVVPGRELEVRLMPATEPPAARGENIAF